MEYETSEVGKTYLRLTKIAFPNLPLTFEIGLLPTMTGCWYTDPCEKYDFVNWDYYDYYSQNKWTNKNHLPNHQPVMVYTIGWWFYPLSKILLSWDDYFQYMEKTNVPNHQPINQLWLYIYINIYIYIYSIIYTIIYILLIIYIIIYIYIYVPMIY